MKLMRIMAVLLLFGSMAAMPAQARLTAREAFATAPDSLDTLFPLLTDNKRLDMIDYFESGSATPTTNLLDGDSRITAMDPDRLTIEMAEGVTTDLVLLPSKGDTLLMVMETILMPEPDSRAAFYGRDWKELPADKLLKLPDLKGWVADKSKADEVTGLLPFLMVSLDYDPAAQVLTATPHMPSTVSLETAETVMPLLYPARRYKWEGNRFKPQP